MLFLGRLQEAISCQFRQLDRIGWREMKCARCGADNSGSQRFCGECGTKLTQPRESPTAQTAEIQTPDSELRTGTTFAGRYQVIEELGKGGMGRVYKVLDTRINEKIALKLIRRDLCPDKETVERFSNELKFARKIRHKNVCQMFDLGESEGTHYITMEYVSGEDLKAMIRMSGQLGIATAIAVARQVAEGLEEAHKLGIVHRDLKPQNIMIDREGKARIMDFGIARSLKGQGITRAGTIIGTPEYMSPEQVEGRDVDQRSDIYSLGVILYEMLTGRVPFDGDSPFTVGMKIRSEIPRDPKEFNRQIPPDLSRLVLKCIEKDRQARYQDAREVDEELEKIEKGIPTAARIIPPTKPVASKEITVTFRQKQILISAVVLVAAVLIGVTLWWFPPRNERIPSVPEKPSLAVLPFEDLSPQKDQEWFCNGITEEIINRLSNIRELKVPARTSAFYFKGKQQDIREIGKTLGVSAVLEGSIQKVGTRLRARVQLVNIADGYHLWSEEYDREVKDVFAMQDEIAIAVVDKLKVTLLGDEKAQLVKHRAVNPAAYEEYLKGLDGWWQWSEEGMTSALRHFGRAIEIEPDYAPAYAGMGLVHITGSGWAHIWPPREGVPKGREFAKKAISLDPALAECYVALGWACMNFDWDWAGAEKELKKALELNPNSSSALDAYSGLLAVRGHFEEAIAVQKRALELDPLSPALWHDMCFPYFEAGELDRAIPPLRKALELDRNFHQSRVLLAFCYHLSGKAAEAAVEFQTLGQLAPDLPLALGSVGYFCAVTGRPEDARKLVSELDQMARKRYVPSWARAIVYIGLGQKSPALDWLEKGCEEHDGWMWTLSRDPWYDPLRKEPRFQALLKKVGPNK